MNLKRTQIYLEPKQHRLLKREANRRGISLSELIRQLVGNHFKEGGPEEEISIVGLGRSGRSKVAKRHDDYLKEAIGGGKEE